MSDRGENASVEVLVWANKTVRREVTRRRCYAIRGVKCSRRDSRSSMTVEREERRSRLDMSYKMEEIRGTVGSL